MKAGRKTLLIVSILIMAITLAYIIMERGATNFFEVKRIIILGLIIILGVIAFVKALQKNKEEKDGIPLEDEFTALIKYKAGYYAFLSSMYMWLFIFLFKGYFPDVETMLGGGILLSGLISYIAKIIVKREINEKQN